MAALARGKRLQCTTLREEESKWGREGGGCVVECGYLEREREREDLIHYYHYYYHRLDDGSPVPPECAIKIFKTTLNEFFRRDKYIKEDYRFKNRFGKQNPRKIVRLWAEKEMHNLKRYSSLA